MVTIGPALAVVMLDQRLVVTAAVVAALGIVLVVAGLAGWVPALSVADSASQAGETAIRSVSAIVAGVLMFLMSGWPVLAGFAAAGGWFALTLKNAKRDRHAAIERVEAIAAWVESLRDNISGSAGLQQALRMSGDHAPAPIRAEVRDLVLRLQHESVVTALRRFAADVAHPTADMAVACLILATSRSAGSLASVLARTAQAARDSAAMMRQVDAGRAATQGQAKLAAIGTGGTSLFMIVARPDFVSPYDTVGGQIALFVICSIVTGSAVMLYRMARPIAQERVFRGVEAGVVAPAPDPGALT